MTGGNPEPPPAPEIHGPGAGDLVTFPESLPTGNQLENLPGNRKGSPGTYSV